MKNKKTVKTDLKIGDRVIGGRRPVFIIAEAGVNHNGNLRLAKKMVDAAKWAGADAVKFQTYKTENLVTAKCPKASYQKETDGRGSQFGMLKKLELSGPEFKDLFDYCNKKKIMFLSTPFDPDSAKFLNSLGMNAFKISSGDLTNTPFLKEIARCGKPVILSTGMSDMAEVRSAVECLSFSGNRKIALLHCTSSYPAKFGDVNLSAMGTLKDAFKMPVGYSDHTPGTEISVAAAAMGASIIEKHFTLNKKMSGPDQAASIEPEEFKNLVMSIRNIEKAIGDGIKRPRGQELDTAKAVRKSLVAAVDINKGAKIIPAMLTVKRPGTGIEPKYLAKAVGGVTICRIKKDSVLKWGMLK